jgi:hypothetical protein
MFSSPQNKVWINHSFYHVKSTKWLTFSKYFRYIGQYSIKYAMQQGRRRGKMEMKFSGKICGFIV